MQAEADYLRNLAEPHLSPSNIESPGSAAEQQLHRNSYTTWAPPKFGDWMGGATDTVLESIVHRGAKLLKTEADLCEGFQVLRYEKGQHYHAHTDYLETPADRYVTVLLYLGDAEGDEPLQGGMTAFPIAGLDPEVQARLAEGYVTDDDDKSIDKALCFGLKVRAFVYLGRPRHIDKCALRSGRPKAQRSSSTTYALPSLGATSRRKCPTNQRFTCHVTWFRAPSARTHWEIDWHQWLCY